LSPVRGRLELGSPAHHYVQAGSELHPSVETPPSSYGELYEAHFGGGDQSYFLNENEVIIAKESGFKSFDSVYFINP
jgi:hypothetical protein